MRRSRFLSIFVSFHSMTDSLTDYDTTTALDYVYIFNLIFSSAVVVAFKEKWKKKRRRTWRKAFLLMILMMIYELVPEAHSLAYISNILARYLHTKVSTHRVRWGKNIRHVYDRKGDFVFMVMTVRYVFSSPSTTVKCEEFIEFWWVFCTAFLRLIFSTNYFYSFSCSLKVGRCGFSRYHQNRSKYDVIEPRAFYRKFCCVVLSSLLISHNSQGWIKSVFACIENDFYDREGNCTRSARNSSSVVSRDEGSKNTECQS